jgi:hypothetical protein
MSTDGFAALLGGILLAAASINWLVTRRRPKSNEDRTVPDVGGGSVPSGTPHTEQGRFDAWDGNIADGGGDGGSGGDGG